jgi:hypothetical protein
MFSRGDVKRGVKMVKDGQPAERRIFAKAIG